MKEWGLGMLENIFLGIMGGALIGSAASLLLLFNGRAAGVSNIFNGILQFSKGDLAWRICFMLGLLSAGFLLARIAPDFEDLTLPIRSLVLTAVGGILVGFGAVMSGGCTSGHGICGLSRFSRRSMVAFVIFVVSGMVTAAILHGLTGTQGGQ